MMDPAKVQRVRNAFSLLRESIGIVKGLKKVMAAGPRQKPVGEAREKAAAHAEAGSSREDTAARNSHARWRSED
jgi:hypothetical protein